MFHPGRTNERGKPLKSITVVLGLVGTVLRNADVVGLTPGQAGQFDAEVVQVQARHLLVEVLRQAVDADRVLLLPQLHLREALVGERVRHHERRMPRGAAEVHQTAFGQNEDRMAVGESELAA